MVYAFAPSHGEGGGYSIVRVHEKQHISTRTHARTDVMPDFLSTGCCCRLLRMSASLLVACTDMHLGGVTFPAAASTPVVSV